MTTDLYAPPSALAEPIVKKRNPWLWGCGGVLLLLILALGACTLLFTKGVDASEPRARLYMQDWSRLNLEEAHRSHADAWKAKDDLATYRRFATTMHQILGPVLSADRESAFLGRFNGQNQATFTFQVHFQKGPGKITLKLIEEHGDWRVFGVNFSSDLITEALRCQACGFQNPGLVALCGQCGKPLPACEAYAIP